MDFKFDSSIIRLKLTEHEDRVGQSSMKTKYFKVRRYEAPEAGPTDFIFSNWLKLNVLIYDNQNRPEFILFLIRCNLVGICIG